MNKLKFGVGSNEFLASSKGDIFITELTPTVSDGKLNMIGVFGNKLDFVIQFSEEAAFSANARVKPIKVDRSIFSIPSGSNLNGTFKIIKRK